MTSHLDSHRATDIKPEMLSGVQTGNGAPHYKYNIRGIANVRTNRKDDICLQRRLVQNFTFILEWGQGTCSLTMHIFPVFFPACWTVPNAALRIFSPDAPYSWDILKPLHSISPVNSNLFF